MYKQILLLLYQTHLCFTRKVTIDRSSHRVAFLNVYNPPLTFIERQKVAYSGKKNPL
jgi:hypothetical protein